MSELFHNSSNNRRPRPSPGEERRQQTIQIPAIAVMVKGLKAEYMVKRHAERAQRHPLDVGFDLFASRTDRVDEVKAGMWTLFTIDTSIHTAIMVPGHMGMIHSRSSSLKTLAGGEIMSGIIDPHYSGEIKVVVRCLTAEAPLVYEALMIAANDEVAIAQMIFVPVVMPMFAQWDETAASQLSRGVAGFGSTNLPPTTPG